MTQVWLFQWIAYIFKKNPFGVTSEPLTQCERHPNPDWAGPTLLAGCGCREPQGQWDQTTYMCGGQMSKISCSRFSVHSLEEAAYRSLALETWGLRIWRLSGLDEWSMLHQAADLCMCVCLWVCVCVSALFVCMAQRWSVLSMQAVAVWCLAQTCWVTGLMKGWPRHARALLH